MKKENLLLIIAIIIFISGLVELFVFVDLYAVAIAMVCSWVTLMTWIIMKKLNRII